MTTHNIEKHTAKQLKNTLKTNLPLCLILPLKSDKKWCASFSFKIYQELKEKNSL